MSAPEQGRAVQAELATLEAHLALDEGDLTQRALGHRDASYLAMDVGEPARAMTHALTAQALAREAGDGPLQVKALVTIALAQAEAFDDLGAAENFAAAEALARDLGDGRGTALVAINAAHQDIERLRYASALERLLALAAAGHLEAMPPDDALRGIYHVNLVVAGAEALRGALPGLARPEVEASVSASVAVLAAPMTEDGEARRIDALERLDALTRHALYQGDYPRALALADERCVLAAEVGGDLVRGRALLDRARVHEERGDPASAQGDAATAADTFRAAGQDLWAAWAQEAVARAHAARGDYRAAYAAQQEVTRGNLGLFRDYHQQRALMEGAAQRAREAEVRAQALAEAALRDPLTGAANRTRAMAALTELLAGAATTGPHALALLDLDHFKAINDRHGHLVGDRVLVEATRVLEAELRDVDLLARFGGEEFAVLLRGVSLQGAAAVCERLRGRLRAHTWDEVAPGLSVTASFGLVALDGGRTPLEALQAADDALYVAKAAGRDVLRLAP